MATILSFKDLVVWQKSHQFVLGIYSVTAAFPREEVYALTSQIRRAAVSIRLILQKDLRKRLYQIRLIFYHIPKVH
jgi:four helix bundle protein